MLLSRNRLLKLYPLAVAALLFLFAVGSAQGQSNTELEGQILDPSGAPIPHAQISLQNLATGEVRHITSDSSGNYLATQLPPAPYRLTVEFTGFRKFVQNGITLQVGQRAHLDAKLVVGETSQTVEVTGDTTLLNTADASLGQSIENRKILDLPLNGRNIVGLAALAAGVMPGSGFGEGIPVARAALAQAAASNVLINGGMAATNDVLIDGVPLSICCQNQIAFLPSIDTTEEFRVRTNMFDAQFGRTGGGIITYATRSGSNNIHGSAFEFLRNKAFDANTFFNNRNKIPIGHYTYNQFGARIGGPIKHDKLFYFGDYEGIRNHRVNSLSGQVPTAAQRSGVFTVPIYDPLNPTQSGTTYTRTAFAQNTIPSTRINAVAAKLIQLYPLPNSTTPGSNYIATAAATDIEDQMNVRLDYVISSKNRLFGRYSYNHNNGDLPDYFHDIASTGDFSQQIRNHNFVVSDTETFSAKFVGTLFYGFTRQSNVRAPRSIGTDLTQYGFPSSYSDNRQNSTLPLISPSGYLGLSSNSLYIRNADVQILNVAFDRLLGRHDLKFGADLRDYQFYWVNNNDAGGNFSFNTGFTRGPNAQTGTGGDAIASFLLGYPSAGDVQVVDPFGSAMRYMGLYVQDDFHVLKNLTVNAGLRWEVETPRSESQNRLSYFDPSASNPLGPTVGMPNLVGGLQFLGVNGNSTTQQGIDWNNVGPRLGFAWTPWTRTAVRGGYGIVSLPMTTRYVNNSNQGFSSTTTYLSSSDGGITPAASLSNPFPSGVQQPLGATPGLLSSIGQTFTTLRYNSSNAYAQQWSLSVQQSLRDDLVFEAAYTASKGTKLPMPLPLNNLNSSLLSMGSTLLQTVPNPFAPYAASGTLSAATVTRLQLLKPFPQFLGITDNAADIGSSSYNALTLRLEKRLRYGFSVLGTFTGGKLITDTSPWVTNYLDNAPGYQDVYNLRADRSVAPEDISRRFAMSYVWELPVGRGKKLLSSSPYVVDLLLGGWQLNGITMYSSGVPIVITNSIATTSGATRPNTDFNWIQPGSEHDRLNQWFRTASFSAPGTYSFGNTPRTLPNLRSGATRNWDMSLFKNFGIWEHVQGQFRAEVFNIFNTVQFSAPGGSYGTASFGVVSSQANQPREMQLALRISF